MLEYAWLEPSFQGASLDTSSGRCRAWHLQPGWDWNTRRSQASYNATLQVQSPLKKGEQPPLFIVRLRLFSNTTLITMPIALLVFCLSTKYQVRDWTRAAARTKSESKFHFAEVRLYQTQKTKILIRSEIWWHLPLQEGAMGFGS